MKKKVWRKTALECSLASHNRVLSFRKLEALTSTSSAVFLTLFLTAITSEIPFFFEAMLSCFIFLNEGSRNAKTNRFNLGLYATAANANEYIVASLCLCRCKRRQNGASL